MNTVMRRLEINGGKVTYDSRWLLRLEPSVRAGYMDAQLDDYGGMGRGDYPWQPGTYMRLRARFSHSQDDLLGTAGFGFWNAPFGDPTVGRPTLPQATWFFFASHPTDLPFPERGPGRGWFVGTMDASTGWSLLLAPLAFPILALNNLRPLQARLWPAVRRRLGISHNPVATAMDEWHSYGLEWTSDVCRFLVDDSLLFETDHSPKGPLGFVCWLDNQYMIATPRGNFRWGTRRIEQPQWLEVTDLHLEKLAISAGERF